MQRKKDDFKSRMHQIALRIDDLNKQINELSGYIDENKALFAELDGKRETEIIAKTIEEIDKRLSTYTALLNNKSKAAEKVAAMTARFGSIDKDVEIVITSYSIHYTKLYDVSDMSYESPEHSTEELYQDITISLLMPYMFLPVVHSTYSC